MAIYAGATLLDTASHPFQSKGAAVDAIYAGSTQVWKYVPAPFGGSLAMANTNGTYASGSTTTLTSVSLNPGYSYTVSMNWPNGETAYCNSGTLPVHLEVRLDGVAVMTTTTVTGNGAGASMRFTAGASYGPSSASSAARTLAIVLVAGAGSGASTGLTASGSLSYTVTAA